jgi:hypothetical protein
MRSVRDSMDAIHSIFGTASANSKIPSLRPPAVDGRITAADKVFPLSRSSGSTFLAHVVIDRLKCER